VAVIGPPVSLHCAYDSQGKVALKSFTLSHIAEVSVTRAVLTQTKRMGVEVIIDHDQMTLAW
jgi:hypothetical protein